MVAVNEVAAPGCVELRARVGIVSFDFYPSYGGQGRHTYDLWRQLRARGVEVRVLSPRSNELPGHSRGGAFSLRAGQSIAFSLYATMAISRWQRRNGIELLHLNGGPGGVIMLREPGARLVYTAHHTYAQQARNVPGQEWKRHLSRLQARAYRRAEVVTADTASTANSLRDELGVDEDKIRVVPSGYDPELFAPLQTYRLERSALFIGRLDGRKGFDFLVRSWAYVAAGDGRARLFVIGRGPLRKWAERYLEERGVVDSVVFLERQPESELVAWYNRVSVVAVPSRFEGFGLTALEALACGTPVVATNTEGLRDVVEDERDGRLVPFGDEAALAEALREAMKQPRRIDARRLEQVRRRYAWPVVADGYIEAYGDALTA